MLCAYMPQLDSLDNVGPAGGWLWTDNSRGSNRYKDEFDMNIVF